MRRPGGAAWGASSGVSGSALFRRERRAREEDAGERRACRRRSPFGLSARSTERATSEPNSGSLLSEPSATMKASYGAATTVFQRATSSRTTRTDARTPRAERDNSDICSFLRGVLRRGLVPSAIAIGGVVAGVTVGSWLSRQAIARSSFDNARNPPRPRVRRGHEGHHDVRRRHRCDGRDCGMVGDASAVSW